MTTNPTEQRPPFPHPEASRPTLTRRHLALSVEHRSAAAPDETAGAASCRALGPRLRRWGRRRVLVLGCRSCPQPLPIAAGGPQSSPGSDWRGAESFTAGSRYGRVICSTCIEGVIFQLPHHMCMPPSSNQSRLSDKAGAASAAQEPHMGPLCLSYLIMLAKFRYTSEKSADPHCHDHLPLRFCCSE